nr:glycosyltransferase [Ruegeria sp. PrR005]
MSTGHGGFVVNLRLDLLPGHHHKLTARAPNKQEFSLEIQVPDTRPIPPRIAPEFLTFDRVAVVVPIYNAYEDVAICIDRLQAHTPAEVDILLINDCSPDPRIAGLLDKARTLPGFRVLENSENMGFTRTINRGLTETGGRDVIILNSDARVTPGWVEGLLQAAQAHPRVATVTAMSDRAGAFSAPNIGNENDLPEGISEEDYARAFRDRSLRLYPSVPTGNGFCMFIARACMDEIGLLDAEAFPRGYGEENDFCMRARRAGWQNLIDDATYVFHDRSKSFGAAKTDLMAAGRKVIDERYPEYSAAIRYYGSSPVLEMARFRARQALEDCQAVQNNLPRALFVVATQTGGTPQTNGDLMDALNDGLDTWVLRCDSRIIELSRYRKGQMKRHRYHRLTDPIEPITHVSAEYDAVVTDWLTALAPKVVHIRHLAWHSLSLPRLAKASGARVFHSFHDFYTVCPSLKLLDTEDIYRPDTKGVSYGAYRPELWREDQMPVLEPEWVIQWQENFQAALAHCDGYVTTTDSARNTILRNLTKLDADRFHVIPHGRDFRTFHQVQLTPTAGERIRILLPGNLSVAKGRDLVFDILAQDKLGLLEFHVLGAVEKDSPTHPRFIKHGAYKRDEFAREVEKIRPHLGGVFSIWDETFCHTLTEMWAIGLPVMVLDFPTLATRVSDSKAGWVLKGQDPVSLYCQITGICGNPGALRTAQGAVRDWQAGLGVAHSTRWMASHYMDLYRLNTPQANRPAARAKERTPQIAVVTPSAPDLQTANASTYIRIWERTLNGLERECNYIRMSPAGLLAGLKMGLYDGAILQRNAVPAMLVDPILEAFQARNIRFMHDLDDDLLNVPEEKDPDGAYAAYAPFLEKLLRNAAAITVSTPPLLECMAPFNDTVLYLPNLLTSRLWSTPPLPRRRDLAIRAFYMGTRTHDPDLEMVLPAFEQVREVYPELTLTMIGVTERDDLPPWIRHLGLKPGQSEYPSFVPLLHHHAQNVDFAIAPLTETAFNDAKSALKILDYGALGLPVLASDTGGYRRLGHKETPPGLTLVPNATDAWVRALTAMVAQGPNRRLPGLALRDWVMTNRFLDPGQCTFDTLVKSTLTP